MDNNISINSKRTEEGTIVDIGINPQIIDDHLIKEVADEIFDRIFSSNIKKKGIVKTLLDGCPFCKNLNTMYPGVANFCESKRTIMLDQEMIQVKDCDRFKSF